MNKEEILAKSRKENDDEGFDHTNHKGNEFGLKSMCAFTIILIAFNMIFRKDTLTYQEANFAVLSLFWSYVSFKQLEIYKFTQKKGSLVFFICGILVGILSLIAYVIGAVM